MKGLVCAFVGATLWGLSGVCSNFLMSAFGIAPLTLVMVRMITAALLFLAFAMWRYRSTFLQMLHDRRTLGGLVIFGAAGLFLCQATYIISINATNAGTATVMQSLNIVMIPIATWLMGRGKLHATEIIGAALAFASVFLIATQGDFGTLVMPLAGLIWGLVNAASESFYTMYPHRLFERWGDTPVTAGGMVVGAVTATIAWLVYGSATGSWAELAFPQLDLMGWLALAGVCVIGTFVAFLLFLKGVSLIGPVKCSLLGAMEPVSAAALCALCLGTTFTQWDWIGLVLMVATIFLVTIRKEEQK